jgi:hypothetical protein
MDTEAFTGKAAYSFPLYSVVVGVAPRWGSVVGCFALPWWAAAMVSDQRYAFRYVTYRDHG